MRAAIRLLRAVHGKRAERRMTSMTHLPSVRHARAVHPLEFPSSNVEWDLGESFHHGRKCDLLFIVMSRLVGAAHSVGKDNFVYYDAKNPKKCLAPDGFLKLDVAQEMFDSWKVWEKGAPELCVEILSPSDTKEFLPLATKMTRYHALGTRELVVFDSELARGARLGAFDRVSGDLVERVVENETTPCLTLSRAFGARFDWVLAPGDGLDLALRLTRDGVLLQTDKEEITELRARLSS
jgi:hypothetical protein